MNKNKARFETAIGALSAIETYDEDVTSSLLVIIEDLVDMRDQLEESAPLTVGELRKARNSDSFIWND